MKFSLCIQEIENHAGWIWEDFAHLRIGKHLFYYETPV